MRTLRPSLLASAIGTGAWILGLAHRMWPAHPQWAVFFLTLGLTAVLDLLVQRKIPQGARSIQAHGYRQ